MKGKLYCDGACRGNPGESAIGVVLEIEGEKETFEFCKKIGKATNNIAEYSALVWGLEKGLEKSCLDIEIYMDSELVVKQIRREYKVKSPNIRSLYQQSQSLLLKYKKYQIKHIPREENTEADALANQALDSED